MLLKKNVFLWLKNKNNFLKKIHFTLAFLGQDGAESFRPNLLVPSAQICFAKTEEGADAEDLQIEKAKYW